jgi:cholesterol oxidase
MNRRMRNPRDKAFDRRAFGARILGAAALYGMRTVGGSAIVSAASLLGSGCAEPRPGALDDADVPFVPLLREHSEAVVIGTGYGGAVVAKRLGEKGVAVQMLEMGRFWNAPGSDGKVFCGINAPDGRAMWFRNKLELGGLMPIDLDIPVTREAGILDVVQSPNMAVYCGRGVGGGSLVNMAMLVIPPRDVLARTFPGLDVDVLLSTYYPRALGVLRGNSVRREFWERTPWYQYSRVGYAASRAAGFDSQFLTSGYDYAYMEQEEVGTVPGSALNAEAGFGNNYGKHSVDKNYLADAVATGNVSIASLHIVREIRRDAGGLYVVSANAIDLSGKLVARKEITCSHLFLCGGSMGTSQLLVRARETGTLENLNDAVGSAWGPNSDIFVMRGNALWNPIGDQISTVPATGFRTVDQQGKAVFSMDIPFPLGIETFLSFNVVMTENPESGTFVYNPVTDSAELVWHAEQNAPAVASARFVFDKINRENATDYMSGLLLGKEFLDNTTYHPVGGCPLGTATDDFGRVRGYDKLYVADSALIPRGLVANPALTVAALAERNIERILAEDFRV